MSNEEIWVIVIVSSPLWLPLSIMILGGVVVGISNITEWIIKWRLDAPNRCRHRWFNILNSEPIEETNMYLFAYRFLGYKEHYGLIKVNTEFDIQSRSVPEQKELSIKTECYCPRCKTKKELSNKDICLLAISRRDEKNTKDIKEKNRWSWLKGKKADK